MDPRTKHTCRRQLYEFVKDILVECPKCGKRAMVDTNGYTFFQTMAENVRVTCSHCAYHKTLNRVSIRSKHFIIGAAFDPFFRLPLWLKTEMYGEVLWAYNHEHLDILEQHVAAKLRERNGFKYRIKGIGARLPRWMTAAKNREEVLKAIERLKVK